MKHSFLIALFLLSPLIARENPFFSSNGLKSEAVTSNVPDTKPPLTSINYTFPNQARILTEVTLTFQNLDGSTEKHTIPVDKSIDWHHPITIYQSNTTSASSPLIKNTASSADFGFLRLNTNNKHLTIATSDKLVRHFVLSGPNRIVLDFNHNSTFKTERKSLNSAPYLDATIENHAKFSRLTITLDGRYRYALKQAGGTISVVCK
ncbi:MAG: AMIN domain-containing protein [Sulfuricurvum sp.]|nr:AMIN domain-containing protein [Sulfuricurvum sp.]